MAHVAEFTIPPQTLPFGATLVDHPDIRLQVERIVPTDESAFPFFWIWGSHPEQFMEKAEDEPEVAKTELLATVNNGGLFQAEWSPDAQLINELTKLDTTIMESEGTSERWTFEVRADDREDFATFQGVFDRHEIPITLASLYDLQEVATNGTSLTREQEKTMVKAYREGYFENPREITQEEIGEQFDISHRAVSDRLRRGTSNLIADALLPSNAP